ncbi:MAG: hypothetical protein HKN87_04760 [Saprospiraceae bacterium]|nr:hypothetical protein [Saprospiraceae bacterium]
MGCATCGSKNGSSPKGCNSNGGCSTGGCNRLNTFDWLSETQIDDFADFEFVEVSFKNGARKDFYRISPHMHVQSGDMVVVDNGSGYDVGRISLTGQLVGLQMKKKKVNRDRILHPVVREAGQRDLEKLGEARDLEKKTLVRARAIARSLGLEMKIGDVEYQGDKRKATFYFTANGRVDFRELIRHYAKEFRVKIEMRQIGSRQESSRIGGLGSCGRELCCSTWLTTFKSVSTRAARYQNLAINQSKLSGQCGRLKCCLNYELDLYTEALDQFPMKAEVLKTKKGTGQLMKVDIFKKLMYYSIKNQIGKISFASLPIDRVRFLYEQNKAGDLPDEFEDRSAMLDEVSLDFEDVTGGVELKELPKHQRRRKSRGKRNSGRGRRRGSKGFKKKN